MYVFGSGRCGWRVGEWMRGLGLGFTNPVGTGGVLGVCLYFGCDGVGGEWVGAWTRVGSGGVVLCLCEERFWILCIYGRSRYLCNVLADTCTSEVHPVFNPVAPYGYLLSDIVLWQISQIQTRLFIVVGPGLVSTSPAFVSSSASHPACPHGRHA